MIQMTFISELLIDCIKYKQKKVEWRISCLGNLYKCWEKLLNICLESVIEIQSFLKELSHTLGDYGYSKDLLL